VTRGAVRDVAARVAGVAILTSCWATPLLVM
jgi:hypothetical protein